MSHDKRIDTAEAVLRALLVDMGTTKFITALHNVGAHGIVFEEHGDCISDAQLGLWFQGIKVLQTVAEGIEGAEEPQPLFYINVSLHEAHRAAGMPAPAKRQFHNMHEATAFVRAECHDNRPPQKIVVCIAGIANEVALSDFT